MASLDHASGDVHHQFPHRPFAGRLAGPDGATPADEACLAFAGYDVDPDAKHAWQLSYRCRGKDIPYLRHDHSPSGVVWFGRSHPLADIPRSGGIALPSGGVAIAGAQQDRYPAMRRIAFALSFALALSPVAIFAQSETVVVPGKTTLSGLWKISFPAGVTGYMPGRGRLISAAVESFCRLEQKGENVSATCLPGWGPDSGDGALDGKELHLAWGIALARAVIDAEIESASVRTFNGAFALKFFGIRHDAPTPASARKLVLDPTTPDTAGKTKLLTQTLEELASGAIVTPHDPDMVLNFGPGITGYKRDTPEEIRNLGRVEAALYLGEGSTVRPRLSELHPAHPLPPFPVFTFSAYQVEFTNGERLCGIHQREDGVLDGLVCI